MKAQVDKAEWRLCDVHLRYQHIKP